ncbi:esterase-like activity of phytase family protein [Phytohalomonas tamaricis]|uniref:esterase-like activity of phytase family protein n=1 Tax=Phytohalomonas tamaricis TaxID=2081032 RepID=UPI000D0B4502|nr:esterase-like activity of phytase family protein [Phytohalomonas tamaricis]
MNNRSLSRLLRLAVLFYSGILSGCAQAGPIDIGGPLSGSRPEPLSWCGTLKLASETAEGIPLGGLSDLAYDQDTHTLYMVSDRGRLYRAKLTFVEGQLTNLNIKDTHRLRDTKGRLLKMPHADSEAMALREEDGQKQLLIGFEEDHRIQSFDLEGHPTAPPIHPSALDGAQYNGSIEALTAHPAYGVIAGLESPPDGAAEKTTRLFDMKGKQWSYQLADATQSGLTSMAPLGDDLLALERAFKPFHPLIISLRRVTLNDDGTTHVTTIAQLSSSEGWLLDNFEGLTSLGGNRYLMVSDDNFNKLQSTLLTCFEVPEQ